MAREAGLSRNWLSAQVDAVLPHILGMVEDLRWKQNVTAEEALRDLTDRLASDPRVHDGGLK